MIHHLIFFLAFVLFGCGGNDGDDCGATGYPPPKFTLDLIDEATGESLFNNGMWPVDEATITDNATGEEIGYHILVKNDTPRLVVQIPSQEKSYTYNFKRNDETVFIMNFNTVAEEMKCYTKTSATDIQIPNREFQVIGNTIKIFF